MQLTGRQREVLDYLTSYSRDNGYMPSLRETGAHLGVNVNCVAEHLKTLERKGAITRLASRSRAIKIVNDDTEKAIEILKRLHGYLLTMSHEEVQYLKQTIILNYLDKAVVLLGGRV